MPELLAVDELGAYLLAQGVAQDPNDGVSLTIPSLWIEARQMAPEPREGEEATITLRDTGLGGASPTESFLEEAFIDIVVRARSAGRAQLLQRTIRGLLTPKDAVGGRKNWPMGAIDPVERSFLWRRDQPLPTTNNGLTYDRVQSFCFQMRVSALSVP